MTLGNTPPGGTGKIYRNPANEETTILTPVTDQTDALNRIPVRQRTLWIVITAILGVLLIASVAITIYMVNVTEDWEQRAAAFESESYDLGADLAAEQELVLEQQARIDRLTEQLQTSNDKLIALADQYANFDDDQAFAQQQVDLLTQLLTTGTGVANALTRCVEGQEQLAVYLRSPDEYDADELDAYEASVNRLCASAKAANREFQEAITQ